MLKKMILSVACVASSAVMASSANFGVVDINKVIESSPQMTTLRASLEKEFQAKGQALQAKIKQFNDDASKLDKEKPVMAKAEIQKKEAELNKRQQTLAQEEQALQQSVMQKNQLMMEEVISKVKAASAEVAKKKGFAMVLQKTAVIVSDASQDMTADVQSKLAK